ncbi:hypothetical protein BaRGS_00002406, partial [Batillaria attramentaria]
SDRRGRGRREGADGENRFSGEATLLPCAGLLPGKDPSSQRSRKLGADSASDPSGKTVQCVLDANRDPTNCTRHSSNATAKGFC